MAASNPPDDKASILGSVIGSTLSALTVSFSQPPPSANAAANVGTPPGQETPLPASTMPEVQSGDVSHWDKVRDKVRDTARHISASVQDGLKEKSSDVNEEL